MKSTIAAITTLAALVAYGSSAYADNTAGTYSSGDTNYNRGSSTESEMNRGATGTGTNYKPGTQYDAQQGMQGTQAKLPHEDHQFMMKAASGGLTEVELGRLALQKASSPEVKKHAQEMIDDHARANRELQNIASTKGVALPERPDKEHQELINKLQGLSGKEFDNAYMREAGIKSHKEMQQLFQREVSSGEDHLVKAFAAKTLPGIEQHLQHFEALAAKSGVEEAPTRHGHAGQPEENQGNTGYRDTWGQKSDTNK